MTVNIISSTVNHIASSQYSYSQCSFWVTGITIPLRCIAIIKEYTMLTVQIIQSQLFLALLNHK